MSRVSCSAKDGLRPRSETDGGNLFAKTIAYRNSGGTPLK